MRSPTTKQTAADSGFLNSSAGSHLLSLLGGAAPGSPTIAADGSSSSSSAGGGSVFAALRQGHAQQPTQPTARKQQQPPQRHISPALGPQIGGSGSGDGGDGAPAATAGNFLFDLLGAGESPVISLLNDFLLFCFCSSCCGPGSVSRVLRWELNGVRDLTNCCGRRAGPRRRLRRR